MKKYPDIKKESVIERRTIRKAINGKPLKASRMKKTKTRLNKWDRNKLKIK